MRVDQTEAGFACVRAFSRSGESERIVILRAPSKQDALDCECPCQPQRVRLIRNVTPNGQQRVLMTKLFDAQLFPASCFGELYHQWWGIEEAFNLETAVGRVQVGSLPVSQLGGTTTLGSRETSNCACSALTKWVTVFSPTSSIKSTSFWRKQRSIAVSRFKRPKHRLNLEHVTGLSQQAVAQDAAAKIVCDYLHALIALTAYANASLPINNRIQHAYAHTALKPLLPTRLT